MQIEIEQAYFTRKKFKRKYTGPENERIVTVKKEKSSKEAVPKEPREEQVIYHRQWACSTLFKFVK